MGFSLSFSLFFVVSVFYVVVVDVLTLLYRITGLTAEQAKFQVISMLTNSGYTTRESELIVDQPVRRRMARVIMLFGYIFSITIVSVFVNVMLALPSSEKEEIWPTLIIISVLFVVFIFVRRIPVVRIAFNSVAEQWGRRWMYGRSGSNMVLVQDEYPEGIIATVTLNTVPSAIQGRSVQQWNDADDHGVYVLYISRGGQVLFRANEETFFKEGDNVVVCGKDLDTIRNVFGGWNGQQEEKGPVSQAPRPVSEREFIHEQDEKAAKEAAMQAREAEKKEVAAEAAKGPQAHAEPIVQKIAAELVRSAEPALADKKAQGGPASESPASGAANEAGAQLAKDVSSGSASAPAGAGEASGQATADGSAGDASGKAAPKANIVAAGPPSKEPADERGPAPAGSSGFARKRKALDPLPGLAKPDSATQEARGASSGSGQAAEADTGPRNAPDPSSGDAAKQK